MAMFSPHAVAISASAMPPVMAVGQFLISEKSERAN